MAARSYSLGLFHNLSSPRANAHGREVERKREMYQETITPERITDALRDKTAFLALFADLESFHYAVGAFRKRKYKLFNALIKYSAQESDSGERLFNNRYMQTVGDCFKLATIFPKMKQQLFALMMKSQQFTDNLKEFPRYNWKPLAELASIYNDSRMLQSLYDKSGLSTLEGYRKIVSCSQALVDLAVTFPEQSGELIGRILSDRSEQARLIRTGIDLAALSKILPAAEQASILKPILTNRTIRARYIEDIADLIALCLSFPMQRSELLRPVLYDPSERERLIDELMKSRKALPIYRRALLKPVLTNSAERERLIHAGIDLEDLYKAYPQDQIALIEAVFTDPVEYKRLIRTSKSLEALGKILSPDEQARLLEPVLSNDLERARLIPNLTVLLSLRKVFPQAALLNPVLTNREIRAKYIIIVDDLIALAQGFPEQRSLLLRPVLQDPAERIRLIEDMDDLIKLRKAFQKYRTALLKPVLTDSAERVRLIGSGEDLVRLCKVYPAQKAALFAPILTSKHERQRLIRSYNSFYKLVETFSEHEDALMEMILSDDNIFKRVVGSFNDLDGLCERFPAHRTKVAELFLVSSDEYFKSVINYAGHIISLAQLFPEQLEHIFARIYSIGLKNTGLFNAKGWLVKFVVIFPLHKADFINYLFENPDVFARYLQNDYLVLMSLCGSIYPEHRNKIMRFAAGCDPQQVASAVDAILQMHSRENIFTVCINELEPTEKRKDAATAELNRFKKEFAESNKMLTAFQRRDFVEFISKYRASLLNLMIVMGPSRALTFLATMTSVSVKHLEQFLLGYRLITRSCHIYLLNRILQEFATSLSGKKTIDVWREILLVLSMLESLGDATTKNGYLVDIEKMCRETQGSSLPAVLKSIVEHSKAVSIKLLELNLRAEELDQEKLNILLSSRYWSSLVLGKRNLVRYRAWKNAMFECDVTNRSLDTLLHDTQQANMSTRMIATHNANIRKELIAASVDADQAIYYKNSHAFTYTESLKKYVDWQILGGNIIICLNAVKSSLEKILLVSDNHVKGLYNNIDRLLKELTKGNWEERLSERIQLVAIEKLVNQLKIKLIKFNDTLIASRNHGELLDQIAYLLKAIKQLEDGRHQVRVRQFRAVQWDKSRADTFLLGNYLDCCLAVNGSEPQAIIERRLDDAMPIHVVIDEETNEPVCGVWLFWAKNMKDEELRLVANYFELNNKHSKDKGLNETLVCNLIYFTGELYTRDVAQNPENIPQLLMRPLEYGNIPEFSKFKRADDRFTCKLGGFCQPQAGMRTRYYLQGLECSDFLRYTLEDLQKEFPDRLVLKPTVAATSASATVSSESAALPQAELMPVALRPR